MAFCGERTGAWLLFSNRYLSPYFALVKGRKKKLRNGLYKVKKRPLLMYSTLLMYRKAESEIESGDEVLALPREAEFQKRKKYRPVGDKRDDN